MCKFKLVRTGGLNVPGDSTRISYNITVNNQAEIKRRE